MNENDYSGWALVSCWQQSPEETDWIECTGNLLIEICTVINGIVLAFMFYWTLEEKGHCTRHTWKRIKVWMIFALLYFEWSIALRYNFTDVPNWLHLS